MTTRPDQSPMPRRPPPRAWAAPALAAALASCATEPVDDALGQQTAAATQASLRPSRDVARVNVWGGGGPAASYALVDDGTSFAASDDGATFVRSTPGATTASHTVGYAGAPRGTVAAVAVNYSASSLGGAVGTARVKLYDGARLIGTGPAHRLGAGFSDLRDTFANLRVADGNQLRTEVVLTNSSGGTTSLRYTVIWLDLAYAAPDGWRLHFADEFSGAALNTAVWKPYFNNYGAGNHQLECQTPANVRVGGGYLTIEARRESVQCPGGGAMRFTSGFLGTRENGVYFPRFGRYEMRARLPHGHALWPAFWLRHRDGAGAAEVDVMEYFHASLPGRTTATLHYDGVANVAKGSRFFETPTATPGFHTWAVEIEPAGAQVCFAYFVDGSRVDYHGRPAGQAYCVPNNGPIAAHPGQPLFDIALNMAVGGDWVGDPDGPLDRLMNGRPAAPSGVRPSVFPARYVIDYVRVYVR